MKTLVHYLTILLVTAHSIRSESPPQQGNNGTQSGVTRTPGKFVTCEGLPNCPFDDLTAEEIRTTIQIIRNSTLFPAGIKFPIIKTQEPLKSDWLAGSAFNERLAYVALFDDGTNRITEVVVDLRTQSILERTTLADGISPKIMSNEYDEADEIIRANPEWQAAITRRGFNHSDIVLDIWAPGGTSPNETGPGKRLLRAICNYRDPKSRFFFWAVLEGLIVNVNLHTGEVDLWDDDEAMSVTSGIEELPDFDNKPPLKPLHISQPQGSSIQVTGQQISWYKWKFQYSIDPIFGLQLYHGTYNGDCEERSVFYKITMAEMFVPYGAKGRGWRWRSAFDAGEYGIGNNANPLVIGVDVPENSVLFDCTLTDDDGGEPTVVPGCVAAFEKDLGILYKHSDLGSGDVDGRRGRALVLTLMTTIANYDYTFDYILNMDGSIEVKSRLTGILLARGVSSATNEDSTCIANCGSFINDYLVGPPHQHFFNYRLDLDIDGVENYGVEINLTADPIGPENPESGVFSPKKEIISTEGFREHSFQSHRSWHVLNANSRNDYGSPRGYALKPESVAFTYMEDDNPFLHHAQFIKHPTWFTKYHDEEQTPGHKFPRTGEPGEGLPKYIENRESLLNSDLVLWYTYGVTHSTRAEEWPIMNVHNAAGFTLAPFNFLSQNSEMPLKDRCTKS